MPNSKKMLILIIITVIIIIIIMSALILYINRGRIFYGIDEIPYEPPAYVPEQKITRVTNKNDFATLKLCTNKYFIYYSGMFEEGTSRYIDEAEEESIKEQQQINASSLYNLLSEEYINDRQITENNIKSKFRKIEDVKVNITDMYMSEKSQDIALYLVIGNIRQKKTGEISNFEIMIIQDRLNSRFAVLPQDYVEEKYNNIRIGEVINIELPDSIKGNEDNVYTFELQTEEEYINELIGNLKEEMLYNQKLAYEHLDEDYKNKKYGTLNNFIQTSKENEIKYMTLKITQYQKTQFDGYTQYMCRDTSGRYYIFKETAPMKYTLILDTYTVDVPAFIAKYTNATQQEKLVLNLNKFREALNDKDYKYAYGLLADSFKANNFQTQTEFENYVKTNFFENNKFQYIEFGEESNTYYTYEVKITDETGTDTREVTKTFIILLEEGTEFKLSFNK